VQENRHRSSPSRPPPDQHPANNNAQHRRPSPAGGKADIPPSRRPDAPAPRADPLGSRPDIPGSRDPPGSRADPPGLRADVAAHLRADFPGSRADILAGARAEVPGPRSGPRVDSPQRQRYPDQGRGAQHPPPAGLISDQFSRPARRDSPGRGFRRESPGRGNRRDSPGRGYRRSQDLSRAADAAQPARRDEPAAPKPIVLSSSDIILRPAVPQSSDHKPSPVSCKYHQFLQ